ncbi:MAG: CGNR zinc finger domain-containing protein [Nocardia sp.]|nr:CGNR zinc finger domain-containing protein [Nocardia sp.]
MRGVGPARRIRTAHEDGIGRRYRRPLPGIQLVSSAAAITTIGCSARNADDRTLAAVLTTRTAVYDTVVHGTRDALIEVLDRGRIRRSLTGTGPADTPEVTDPAWLPGWPAADNLLTLLADAPDRIRRCAHPDCILFFYDTSKNGTRRRHSMTTCGNRAKAARHHARRT